MKSKKYGIQILAFLLFITLSMHAQKEVVHGKITTFNSITVENAEITIKKTKNSVFSDSLGYFSIECNLKDKVSIKAAGFKTKSVKVKNLKDSLNVNLQIEDSERSIDLAMSKGHIDKSDLSLVKKYFKAKKQYSLGYTNMTDLIKGKFPQINIVNNELILRGINSIDSRNGALIVLNGTEYNWSSVKTMEVTNIKDIRILKGSEASRYGTGSSNGVLVIKLIDE